jgi:hypothetical protein
MGEDTTAPTFDSLTLSDAVIDIDSGERIVFVNVHLTDDQSGVKWAVAQFQSENGQTAIAWFQLLSGTPTDGIYRAAVSLGPFADAGEWHISSLNIEDQAGHSVFFTPDETPELAAVTFEVVNSNTDASGPTFDSLTLSDAVIDIDSGERIHRWHISSRCVAGSLCRCRGMAHQ